MRRALVVVVLLLYVGCRETDPVAQTIHEIADAAEARDAGAVLEHLSTHYNDANGDRAAIEQTLRRYFFAYRSIDVTVTRLETSHDASSGHAAFRVLFLGAPKSVGGMDQFLPRSATYDFEVWMEEEDGELKITTAQWREGSLTGS